MLKELNEDVEKVKKMMYEKNRNINKTYLENLNRNQNETLEWKSTKQKNESGSLKIGQLKYLSPRNRRKKD